VLAIASATAETNIQTNPEIEDQRKQQRHESESRKVPCEPTSLAGTDDEENGAFRHKSQLSAQNNEQGKESLPNTEGTDRNVLEEQDNMQTEEPPAAQPTKRRKTHTSGVRKQDGH
jgi:hypothetical protein